MGVVDLTVIWKPINIHMSMYEMNSDMGADRYKKSFIFMRWGGRFYRDVEVGYV